MTGICTECGRANQVRSFRGSKLADYQSRCCHAPMKGPPHKPRGMPYLFWTGSYDERYEIVKRWKSGEMFSVVVAYDSPSLAYYTRQIEAAGGRITDTTDGRLMEMSK